MKKRAVVVLVVLALLLVGGGYGGWVMYGRHQVRQSIAPHIKNVTLRLQDALQIEITPTSMTYGELFSKLDENLKDVDRRLLEIRSMDTSAYPQLAASAEIYMRASQEVFRRQANAYRHQLDVNAAQDWYLKMMRNYEGTEFERRQRQKDLDSIREKAQESGLSLVEYGLGLLELERVVMEVGSNFDPAVVLGLDLPRKVRAKVDERVKDVEVQGNRPSDHRQDRSTVGWVPHPTSPGLECRKDDPTYCRTTR